jgi:hypothetical protein
MNHSNTTAACILYAAIWIVGMFGIAEPLLSQSLR